MKALFPSLRVLDPVVANGDKGVDLFFILSGFILAYNYAEKMRSFELAESGRFLLLRLARVYPVHVFAQAVWIGFLLLNLAVHHMQFPPGSYNAWAFVANLLLIQAWSVPMHMSWNYPAWSVSLEWLAYLQFPFLAIGISRLRSKAAVVAVICLLALSAPAFSGQPFFHFVRIESEFTCGILMYWLYREGFGGHVNWGRVATLSAIASLCMVYWLTWFVFPLFVVLLYSLAMARGGLVTRALSSRAANYWGRASYSLYMMHAAVISALHVIVPPQRFSGSGYAVRALILMLYPTCAAAVAAATLHWIEEPGRKAIRNLTRPTHRPQTEPAAAGNTHD